MDNTENTFPTEEESYLQYKRQQEQKNNLANIQKIECDYLFPTIDKSDLKQTCRTLNGLKVGAIVVWPSYVKLCVGYLGRDPEVSLVAAISYPYGQDTTEAKVLAVKRAVKDGVDEVEVYAPMSLIREGNYQYFKRECKKVKSAAKIRAVRLVMDCAQIPEQELLKAVNMAADVGVNCIRLNNADSNMISVVKNALNGKCLIKAEGAGSKAQFISYCAHGADAIQCKSPEDMAAAFSVTV